MSFPVALPPTDGCPACDAGHLRPAAGERLPASGGPRTLVCDSCGWSATFNVHGSDRPDDARGRAR